MKDELWMRTWNDGHPRFSDDLHRGLLWLFAPLRRLGARIVRRAATAEPAPLTAPRRDAA
ncbi:hypothetical protein [Sphingopyxis sp.]|jgi:hypothetical protein|uniref:hypothetical protein n=1 Tax=Sphingopyxis sp. TaxID=1908224 RepID=UPI003F6EB255